MGLGLSWPWDRMKITLNVDSGCRPSLCHLLLSLVMDMRPKPQQINFMDHGILTIACRTFVWVFNVNWTLLQTTSTVKYWFILAYIIFHVNNHQVTMEEVVVFCWLCWGVVYERAFVIMFTKMNSFIISFIIHLVREFSQCPFMPCGCSLGHMNSWLGMCGCNYFNSSMSCWWTISCKLSMPPPF